MVTFDDKKQQEKLQDLYQKEEEELAKALAPKYGVSYVDLTRISIDTDALRLVPEERARSAEIAPFKKIGKKLFVAMRAPNRADSLMEIQNLERLGYLVRKFIASTASLEHAWEHYGDLSHASATEGGILHIANDEIQKTMDTLKSVDDLIEKIKEVSKSKDVHKVTKVLEILLGGGLALDASDIHIEPEEDGVRVRFRLDGVLTDIMDMDFDTYKKVISRIKLLSGMKLNLNNIAQDGRFSVKVGKTEIEIRSSIIPGAYGETAVMRLLNPEKIMLTLDKLGMDDFLVEIFKREIRKPNGMILNTGPTGSGKTTTLYAFLREVNKPGTKIITLENPIEYHLEGIVQTQISKNYTFASGLRAILRQDPDIIMVGEIRDHEVASTAVHAALTGHLVFSTLHTNNAAGTFPRLIDMGIDPEILGSAVTLTMAQRLTRKLCPFCRRATVAEGKDKETIDRILAGIPRPDDLPPNREIIWEPVGCDRCNGIGYKGRVAIFEAILMDANVREIVRKNPSEIEIWRAAQSQQIRRMAEYGIVKVLEGVTSLEELSRVVDLDEQMR